MSLELPARPNLEHLKKQAKELLHELQRRNPAAQLADAQHELAREYGFASWPRLKFHVESAVAAPAEARSPFSGRWLADLSRSKCHPANPFQRAMIEVDVAGDVLRIADVVVDASGSEESRLNTIQVDGCEYLSEAGNGYRVMARWCGPHAFETVAKKDDQVVGSGRYEVSADGRTLTVSGDQLLIVLDRVVNAGGPF
jgi:hypothetical protein